jgi:hypothetical protein
MKAKLHLAVAVAVLLAGPATSAAEPAAPVMSAAQAQAVGELGRCLRASYLNRIARERLAPFLSGDEGMRSFDDMERVQDYTDELNDWVAELIEHFGRDQVLRLMPPYPAEDEAFLKEDSSTETKARAVLAATARESNVCIAGEESLRKKLAAP